jgi:hypothetical protein
LSEQRWRAATGCAPSLLTQQKIMVRNMHGWRTITIHLGHFR